MIKHIIKPLLITLFSFFIFSCKVASPKEKITDLIKPINLHAGKSTSVIFSDLFYSDNYDAEFLPNKIINIKLFNDSLVITPDSSFEGMTLIKFKLDMNIYSIPVISKKEKFYKFYFEPGKKYKLLTLFGSFNGWNRKELEMKDPDGDGIYETKVPLEPGIYQYKFFGDGEEIVDPNNPEKVPNGMGDFNSVISIENSEIKPILHIDKFSASNNKFRYSFFYQPAHNNSTLKNTDVIALVDNYQVPADKISIEKNKISISLDVGKVTGKRYLRAAVSNRNGYSNIQTAVLFDGKPAGVNNFTWHDAVIYSLMIDRFKDGNKSLNKPVVHDSLSPKANYMGGDLQGIVDELNSGYFDSLGINVLWISPVYDNPNTAYREYPAPHRYYSGYHGYWPISSHRIDEHFGNMELLKELVAAAHRHNIKVLLDFVSNHVHELHPFYKEHKDWFGKLKLPDGRLNLRFWDEFRLTTWFEPYLPSFDYQSSQEAVDTMTADAAWWLKTTGADGFRHDAVKHVPNNFWRSLTRKLKKEVAPDREIDVYQIGETFGSYELINSYVNNGQLNAQFNFNVYDVALPVFIKKDVSFGTLAKELQKSFSVYGQSNLMGNIMDSHDKNRFMAFADGDLDVTQWSAIEEGWNNPPKVDNPENYKKLILYMAYMNTVPGIPVIYYGSEFGMSGASDPDNRRMMRFGNQLSKGETATLSEVSKIVNLRKAHSALNYGDFIMLKADKNIFSYLRSDFNERLLIILNKSKVIQRVSLNLPDEYNTYILEDLSSKQKYPCERANVSITIQSESYKILKLIE